MRKTELNRVIESIKKSGLNATHFDIQRDDGGCTVTLKDSKLRFVFLADPSSFEKFRTSYIVYNPQYPQLDKPALHIVDVLLNFEKWIKTNVLKYLYEVNLPDPIEQFKKETASAFSDIDDNDDASFNQIEKDNIEEAIKRFQLLLEDNFELPIETKEVVEKKLKHLSESKERLSKRDFKAVGQKIIYDIGISIAANVAIAAGTSIVNSNFLIQYLELVQQAFQIVLTLK